MRRVSIGTQSPILSLDQPEPPAAWRWAGPEWERLPRRDVAIVGAELQSANAAALAARWGEILGLAPRGLEIPLDGGVLRFVPAIDGRGEGLGAIDVAVPDRGRVLREAEARSVTRTDGGVVVGGLRIRLA
jgi:hypothetical protein